MGAKECPTGREEGVKAGGSSKLKIQRALACRPDFKRSHLAVCRKKVLHQRFQAHFPVLNELHRSHSCLLSLGSFLREGLDAEKKKKKKEEERRIIADGC